MMESRRPRFLPDEVELDCEEDFTVYPCEPPDVHYMDAAQAWLELGDAVSAREELTHLNSCLKSHPDVLLLSWDIHAKLGKWNEANEIAQELMRVIPDDLGSWLNYSVSLRYMDGGGVELAYEALLPGEANFGWSHVFNLYLARYACQLGRLEEARQWLWCAFRIGLEKETALDEPDLEPIWQCVDRLKKR